MNSTAKRYNRVSLARAFTGVLAVMGATPFVTSPTVVEAQGGPAVIYTCQEQITTGILQAYGLPTPAQAASGNFGPFVGGETGTESLGSAKVSNPGAKVTCDMDTRAAFKANPTWPNPRAVCSLDYGIFGVPQFTSVVEAVDNFSPPFSPPYRRVNGFAVNCIAGKVPLNGIEHFGTLLVKNVPGI